MMAKNDHGHTHGVMDASIVSHERGLWAVKWSFAGLMATALIQIVIVLISGSVALLADTIHNVADAATAIPLGVAFLLARRKPSKRFTYGYGRVEDLAGTIIVILIFFSAVVAAYESMHRFFDPQPVNHLWAVALASIVGFTGNEAVAILRIKVGKEIGSAALIADGYHARIDGWGSLAVLAGVIGMWFGFPLADPIAGFVITVSILFIVWDVAKAIVIRMLDGVEPAVIDEIRHAIGHVEGVKSIGEIRARWIGHKLYADINISVSKDASVSEGHEIAHEVSHQVLDHIPQLGKAVVHVDPEDKPGEQYHPCPHDHSR